jgi:hypothetical protein
LLISHVFALAYRLCSTWIWVTSWRHFWIF